MSNVTCGKCDGKGHINGFSHYANGVCFDCGGSGKVRVLSEGNKRTQAVNLLVQEATDALGWATEGDMATACRIVDRLIPDFFRVGTTGAREVLDYVGKGRFWCSERQEWRQCPVSVASKLRAYIIARGFEAKKGA